MTHAGTTEGLPSFSHGVHPEEHKGATESLPIERMPFVSHYVLPLAQHIGRPSKCIVRPGQHVQRGERIADPNGFVSTALHAPVTGTVEAVELRPHPNGKLAESIVIAIDAFASQEMQEPQKPEGGAGGPNGSSRIDGFVRRVQEAGIVGLGGAAFPSHVKLQVPEGKKVTTVVLNGCECEPYLTCDHRVMLEDADKVVRGMRLIMQQLGAAHGYIGVERNKSDAIETLRAALSQNDSQNDSQKGSIEIIALQVKYPQGAEKMLIDAVLHERVPAGGLPLDLEIVVHNVATASAIADMVENDTPLIERVITVTGDGVRRPANVVVPLGTPIAAVLEHCGGLKPEARQVILGGPMMGVAQKELDVPVVKGTSGILALTQPQRVVGEQPCIRCGRCLDACPMFLNPARLAQLVRNERAEGLLSHHVMSCFECASCSFVCPSHIPLVHLIRVGKAMARKVAVP